MNKMNVSKKTVLALGIAALTVNVASANNNTLGGETQFNINAAFRTGRGSEYEPQAKNGELEQLRQEVETLKALVNK